VAGNDLPVRIDQNGLCEIVFVDAFGNCPYLSSAMFTWVSGIGNEAGRRDIRELPAWRYSLAIKL
jgi:hypothetical protein